MLVTSGKLWLTGWGLACSVPVASAQGEQTWVIVFSVNWEVNILESRRPRPS